METIRIKKSDEFVSDNFTYNEYFDPEFGGGIEFDIPKAIIDGIQFMRDYFGISMDVTCANMPNQTFGYHKLGLAVDVIPTDRTKAYEILKKFKAECSNYQQKRDSPLIEGMRACGITGFGVEKSCIHCDCRPEEKGLSKDKYGKYTVFKWTNDGSKYGKSEVIY